MENIVELGAMVKSGLTKRSKDMDELFQDYSEKRRVSMCVGCGSQIHDQYILRVAPDLEWHASCLKCADCHTFLDETSTCFVRDGKTYCKQDYVRLFGTKCAKCSQGFSKNDFVMRARSKIYHVDCFRCVACSRQLVPGDEFALREDALYCKVDNDVLERASISTQSLHSGINSQKNSPSAQSNGGTAQNDSGNGTIISDTNGNPNSNTCSNNNGSSKGRKPEKTTRVRTVLNEKQLHTLRTCYAANPRPDAVMKEQLVEMTGLSPRVIRVWFQNKRCKDKKRSILMKNQIQAQQQAVQQDVQNHNCSVVVTNSPLPPRSVTQSSMSAISGVPMLGNSPVHAPPTPHDMVTHEVGGYQPWKALSEFAMQAEIEQQPFQQLVHFSEQANVAADSIVSSATN